MAGGDPGEAAADGATGDLHRIAGVFKDADGAAMKVLMPKLKGEADGNTIRQLVLEELGRL